VSCVVYNILVNKLLILLNYLDSSRKCLINIISNITKLVIPLLNVIKEIV
jgi:hypothetical protein